MTDDMETDLEEAMRKERKQLDVIEGELGFCR